MHPQGCPTIRTNCQQEIKTHLENYIRMGILTCPNRQKYGGNPRIRKFSCRAEGRFTALPGVSCQSSLNHILTVKNVESHPLRVAVSLWAEPGLWAWGINKRPGLGRRSKAETLEQSVCSKPGGSVLVSCSYPDSCQIRPNTSIHHDGGKMQITVVKTVATANQTVSFTDFFDIVIPPCIWR